ncbi:MAG: glycosyltransferase, partial [Magnetococcus sp. DMHC-1]
LNFRTFEVMACGSLLFMEDIGPEALGGLFQPGHHMVTYRKGDVDQVVELYHYYLAHEEERRTIAQRGWQAVHDGHTSLHRAQQILTSLASDSLQEGIRRRSMAIMEIERCQADVFAEAGTLYHHSATVQTHPAQSELFRSMGDQYTLLANSLRQRFGIKA